jgi:hypothetical protein
MGNNPTNQTTIIGKFPIGFNATNLLCKSFESNMPRLYASIDAEVRSFYFQKESNIRQND